MAEKKFNRSEFMKKLHKKARLEREFFSSRFKDEAKKYKYSDFLSKNSPVYQKVAVYEVSFQLSYSSDSNILQMSNKATYLVYAIESPELENEIYERTKEAILDMKGNSGSGFNDGTKRFLNNNDKYLNIELEPRGVEKSLKQYDLDNYLKRLETQDLIIEGLDTIELKNKSGGKFKQKIDLLHFIR